MAFERIPNLVSIVIPTYNREKYIKECLDSLVNQTYKNIEIIIVDDGSTDNTVKVIKNYIKEITNLKKELKDHIICVSFPRNVGYSGPLTTGMFLTKGEFIARQDSDDLCHIERIEKQIEYLKKNPHIDLVGTLYASFKDGHFPKVGNPPRWIKFGEDIEKSYKRGGHCICHGTILFKGIVFDRLGGYTRRRYKAADAEFLSHLISNGVKADNIPEVLYYYRRHSLQMIKTVKERKL